MRDIEYMVLPRLCGYGEIGWTLRRQRSWSDYRARLDEHQRVLDAMQVCYHPLNCLDAAGASDCFRTAVDGVAAESEPETHP